VLQGRRVCTSYGQFKNDWFSKALWRTDYSIGFGQRILIPSGGRHASMGGADHRGKSHMAGHSPLTRFQAPSGSGGAAPYAATSNGDASVYAAGGGQVQQVQDNPNYAHLPALERSILTCMQSAPPDEDGIDVPFIVGRLSTQGTRAGASEISYVVIILSHPT